MDAYDTTVFFEEITDLRDRLMAALRFNWRPHDLRETYKPLAAALASVLGWLKAYPAGEATVDGYFAAGALALDALRQVEEPLGTDLHPMTDTDRALGADMLAYLTGALTEKTPALIDYERRLREAKAEHDELRGLWEVEF